MDGNKSGLTFCVRCALLVVILSVVTLAGSAAGQGTAASIVGRVTDESGGVLPGVTVTATSPALQVPQVTNVTNAQGEYRLAPLPIGDYELTFVLTGFGTARQPEVRLTVGFTAKIDMVLKIATVGETITVTAAAPVVDISPTSGTLLTKETLEATPTARNGLISLMSLAPGVRTSFEIGGAGMTDNPGARVFGQGGEPWWTLEGVATATLGGTGSGNFYDYQTIEETRVQSLGTDASAPTRGVQVNAIVKSGGNDFHGGALWTQTSQRFSSNNIDSALTAVGITTGDALVKRYDVGGDLGGRLIRNRLWFYGAARKEGQKSTVLGAFNPDGSSALKTGDEGFYTGKVSYQATPSNRFIGFYQQWRVVKNEDQSETTAYEARSNPHNLAKFTKGEWQTVRGNSLTASLQFGFRQYKMQNPGSTADIPFLTPGLVGRSDIATQKVWGESAEAGEIYHEHRYHTSGIVNWYKPDSFHGNHEVKAGFDYTVDTSTRGEAKAVPFNYGLIYNNGAAFELFAFNFPTVPPVALNYLGAYATDRWTIARRLTLDAGLRFENNNGFVPAACREAAASPGNLAFPAGCFPKVQLPIWRSVAPRLHASYDLSGDGKTVIKGGWGRYDHIHLITDLTGVARNAEANALYTWRDGNGNGNYDPGEINLDPGGPDFIRYTGRVSSPYTANSFSSPPTNVVNPNLKQPKSDEFSLSLERELAAQFAMRVTGVYSLYKNIYRLVGTFRPYSAYNIPITKPDPGPDGKAGTADDPGTSFTYFEYSSTLVGPQFEELMAVNDPAANQTYSSVELAAFKRLANRWQFMASYSATKKNKPLNSALAVSGTGASVQAANVNPNIINQDDRTWDYGGKVSGSYLFPAGVTASANLLIQSGDAFARQVLFTGGKTITSIVLNVEPIGSQRLPTVKLLAARLEKSFRVNANKVAVRLDVFNALNANTATSLQPRSGASFLRPRAILPPRIAQLSLTYSF